MNFRWKYVALPVSLCLLSIIITAIFFAQLPQDVAYHFQDGTPDRTMARGAFMMWMILPHIFLTLMAASIIRIAMFGAKYAPPGETPLLELLPLMGNMVVLPQVVLFIAMLQFILFNVFNTGMIPLWIITLAVLIVGSIVLVMMFMRISRKYRKKKTKIVQE